MTRDLMNQTVTLRDGRRLGFAEYGDRGGRPVFFFHGAGGSRLEGPADESPLREGAVRLIATDRPGHGLSDPMPNRTLLDWPADVAQLADHLGLERFHVLGWSSGGPHALACAYALSARLAAAAIICGVAPSERPHPYRGMPLPSRTLLFGERNFAPLVTLMRRMSRSMIMGDPQEAGRKASSFFQPEDQVLIDSPDAQARFVRDLQEGYRQGWQGPVQDDLLVNRTWGFALEEIIAPVDIWAGEVDQMVPVEQAHYLHARLPHSRLTIWPQQGHLYLRKCWGEVLTALVAQR